MKRLIIMEGPDAGGKSTMSRWLADAINAELFHCTWTPALNPAMRDYTLNVWENVRRTLARGRSMVLDRFWPSQWVYGHVMRKDRWANEEWLHDLHRQVLAYGGQYVLCSDGVTVQIARHSQIRNPDHPYVDSAYAEIVGEYFAWAQMLEKTGVPVHRYSILKHGLTDQTRDLWLQQLTSQHEDEQLRAGQD